jgi:uncharacterized protein (TIGR02246 family)
MKQLLLVVALATTSVAMPCKAQSSANEVAGSIREQLKSYVETFNKHDAKAVAGCWTTDAVSVQEETDARTEGRAAILADFEQFFRDYPKAQLAGAVEQVCPVSGDVAIAEGQITLATGEEEPTRSAFTAVLKKEGERWLIASSHERDLPVPATATDALQELEWFVGTWRDQTEGASVLTTVRWSPSRTFLIRSFEATFEDGEGFSGTQIFGWDPLAKQIRTWVFNSDGSFGDGAMSKNGDDWMIKMNQMQSDGHLASGTTVITRLNDDTIEVQKLGESIDGEPILASEPVRVVRVTATEGVSAVVTPAVEGAGR